MDSRLEEKYDSSILLLVFGRGLFRINARENVTLCTLRASGQLVEQSFRWERRVVTSILCVGSTVRSEISRGSFVAGSSPATGALT
ncbi:hypothetical protein PoB_004867600 [Plakobranchus ocellatus]|uniref:Uncharacterized protein n=1 Tax=Plakobranchus ocellatus TaxID=259542 RepID=A0AAV4BSW5_9GAST|nr:hypothetical protein PoB_004867600 [Plakobranchus ocellatus]